MRLLYDRLLGTVLLNMKLTVKQKDALQTLKEEKSISKDGCKIHNNIMNALYFKGLVRLPRYANGEFWEITDAGLDALS
jgi:hypothetical protein